MIFVPPISKPTNILFIIKPLNTVDY